MDEFIGMGLSDESFLTQVAEKMQKMEEPFYSFIITLTSHHPFTMDEKYCKINLKEEHKGTLFGDYINSINYFDTALQKFFNELKEKGLYEDSIFVIYGDHFGIANYNYPDVYFVKELMDSQYTYMDMLNVPLIIHIPEMEKAETIETVAGHVDVLPTLLHLLGIENNKGIMMGNDIFSVDENIVYEMMHVGEGSFITNDVFYYSSISGIEVFNKAYDLKTGSEVVITNEMLKGSRKAIEALRNARALLNANRIIRD